MIRPFIVAVIGLNVGAGTVAAQAPCAVRGVWVLESETVDGQAQSLGQRRSMKIVTASHFAFTTQEPTPAALESVADSLAAYRTRFFGGGTYRVSGSTYAETLEYFHDPRYVGREITMSCRIAGDRWHHSFEWPVLEGGRETRRMRVVEVWRRIE